MKLMRVEWEGTAYWAEVEGEVLYALEADPFQPVRTQRLCSASDARILAPIAPTNKVVALMGSFNGRGTRKGSGLFIKPNSCIIPADEDIVWPAGVERINFESELGVVIGRRARNISEADALDHVLGYTVTNDVTSFSALSEDGVQSLSLRFKLYDTFLPIGPRIVCDIDVSDRRLTARLNGEIKQDVSTADMSFQVAETVAWASSVMTLNAGDIISMGTPPGFCDMREGDVVECEIEGVGVLRNRVRRGL